MKNVKKVKNKSKLQIATMFVVCFLVLSLICIFAFDFYYQARIFPGYYVGNIYLGNLTKEQAKFILQNNLLKFQKGFEVKVVDHNNKVVDKFTLPSRLDEGGLEISLFDYKIDKIVSSVYNYHRYKAPFKNIYFIFRGFFINTKLSLLYEINEDEIYLWLEKFFKNKKKHAINANFHIKLLDYKEGDKVNFDFIVDNEQVGIDYDFEGLVEQIKRSIKSGNYNILSLKYLEIQPKIKQNDLLKFKDKIKNLLKRGNLVLQYNTKKWKVLPLQYSAWIKLVPFDYDFTKNYDYLNPSQVDIGFDKEKLSQFLMEKVYADIFEKPVDAVFEYNGKKVTKFVPSKEGVSLDVDKSIFKINKTFFKENNNVIELVVKKIQPKVTTEQSNPFGIKEIIGIGRSNFAGSPPNRRNNIRVGAAAVNGTLIAPGEEFSLVKVLGKIDASTGYKPELVIKDGRTIPEYGGGLCQIGTTTFRGALDAGLPITQRRNHSYRVRYYEPAGTDATIYGPYVDFRFKNDMKTYVLIITKIKGDELIWEYWGTKDGRKSIVNKPKIYNIRKPPPTKYIETTELPPGKKKCIEKAHSGATAELTRTVIYPDGTEKKDKWISYYKPWPEICLIGVEKKQNSKK